MNGNLYIISAPSGAGKTTLIKKFLKEHKSFIFSISYTTRPKRKLEINGKDYFFVSQKTFEQMIENNKFLEYAKVHDNYYGTGKDFVLENLNKGKHVILDIDYQGAKKVKENLDLNKYHVIGIFIFPPSYNELKKRIEKRGQDSEDIINKRLKNALEEMKNYIYYDYIIVNDIFNKAYKELSSIIIAETLKKDLVENKINNLIKKYEEDLNG